MTAANSPAELERFDRTERVVHWVTAVLVGVAGLTYVVKAGGGLYWLIPAVVASLLGGVVNAWLFLVRVTG